MSMTRHNVWCVWELEGLKKMMIYCCGCKTKIEARLTHGAEVYPHLQSLATIPFWKCDNCGNHVGCHYKTKNRTRPLGVIATPELKKARQHIHRLIDPIWQGKHMSRNQLYKLIAKRMNWKEYHTANIKTVDDARRVYMIGKDIFKEVWG